MAARAASAGTRSGSHDGHRSHRFQPRDARSLPEAGSRRPRSWPRRARSRGVADPDGRIPVPQMATSGAKPTNCRTTRPRPARDRSAAPGPPVIEFLSHHALRWEPRSQGRRVLPAHQQHRSASPQRRRARGDDDGGRLTNPAVLTRPYAEYTMAAIFLHARRMINGRVPIGSRASSSHPRPESTQRHGGSFGCPVLFGARVVSSFRARPGTGRASPSTRRSTTSSDSHARILLDGSPGTRVSRAGCEGDRSGTARRRPALNTIARRLE